MPNWPEAIYWQSNKSKLECDFIPYLFTCLQCLYGIFTDENIVTIIMSVVLTYDNHLQMNYVYRYNTHLFRMAMKWRITHWSWQILVVNNENFQKKVYMKWLCFLHSTKTPRCEKTIQYEEIVQIYGIGYVCSTAFEVFPQMFDSLLTGICVTQWWRNTIKQMLIKDNLTKIIND